jgi:lipopolysaccharide transport system permease protein
MSIVTSLVQLNKRRELLWMWMQREIQIRYKQSFLGVAWAILQPLVLMAIFSVVFSLLLNVPSDNLPYPLFSYAAVLPWTFLASSLNFSIPSLVNNMNLVTKVYFPREILPIGNVGAALVDFGVAGIIFIGMMIWYRVDLTLQLLWLPLVLFVQLLLVLGISLAASAINVFFRDVRFIIPLGLQLWMYASPVIYSINIVPGYLQGIYMLNPMVGLLDAYRRILLNGQPPDALRFGISTVFAVLSFILGYRFFKRLEPKFADII